MIKFHPNTEMLNEHLAGKLPLPLTTAISAHIELCQQCKQKADELELLQSQQLWQKNDVEPVDFGDMLQSILAQTPESSFSLFEKGKTMISVNKKHYHLPLAFHPFSELKWSGFGAVSRARVFSNESNARGSLLHIDKGGRIPMHQHQGYELTLLLEGSFADENGVYRKGDFIYLEGEGEHAPFSKEGCLCYVVQNAPIQFVKGMSKVLNPLTDLLY